MFLITFINDLAPTAVTADTTVESFGVAEYNLRQHPIDVYRGGRVQAVHSTWVQDARGRSGRPQEVYAPHATDGGQKGRTEDKRRGSSLPLFTLDKRQWRFCIPSWDRWRCRCQKWSTWERATLHTRMYRPSWQLQRSTSGRPRRIWATPSSLHIPAGAALGLHGHHLGRTYPWICRVQGGYEWSFKPISRW